MKNKLLFIIAVIFSVAIVVENTNQILRLYFWLFGPPPTTDYLIAALSLLAPIGLLWLGYWYVRKKTLHHTISFFAIFAVVVFIGMDILFMPEFSEGPIKKAYFIITKWHQIDNIQVSYQGDEPLLSAEGNPIGIRVMYLLPNQNGISNLSLIYLGPRQNPTQSGFSPTDTSLAGFEQYVIHGGEKVLYADFIPDFLYQPRSSDDYCISNPDAADSHKEAGLKKYEVNFEFVGKHTTLDQASIKTFGTEREYNIYDFYQSALKEKKKKCTWGATSTSALLQE